MQSNWMLLLMLLGVVLFGSVGFFQMNQARPLPVVVQTAK